MKDTKDTVYQLYPYARNPIKRALAESILKEQDGLCQRCRERKILEIDHIDGNPQNWALQNLRLLCHSCNIAVRNSQRSMLIERKNEEANKRKATNPTDLLHNLVDYQGGGPEMQANDIGIPKWIDWLCQSLLDNGGIISRFEAINKGAAASGLTYQPIWRAYNKNVYQPEKESMPDPFAPFIEEKDERTGKRTVRLRIGFRIKKVGKLLKPVPKTEDDSFVLMKDGKPVKDLHMGKEDVEERKE